MQVANASELASALKVARAGDVVLLAAGTYEGQFVLARSGTATSPISVCGPRSAVLDGRGIDHGYVMHLQDSRYSNLMGFTVRNGLKGIMTDSWTYGRIDHVAVTHIGQEGIHLRTNSSHDVISDSSVSGTGLSSRPDSVHYGEGIYIGSAVNNWGQYTGGAPDRSDDDLIERNQISDTTAESIDVKEGTTGGRVIDNRFDGAGMRAPDGADSWVDAKGNGWTFSGNVGEHSPADGFQVHVKVKGWGRSNVFRANRIVLDHKGGVGISIGSGAAGAVVACTNTVTGPDATFTNIGSRCKVSVSAPATQTRSHGAWWIAIAVGLVAAFAFGLGILFRRRQRAKNHIGQVGGPPAG